MHADNSTTLKIKSPLNSEDFFWRAISADIEKAKSLFDGTDEGAPDSRSSSQAVAQCSKIVGLAEQFIIDGEIAALNPKGRSSFQLLQAYEIGGDKEKLLAVARQFELEGLIAKKPDSVYESGRRSGAWVKFKTTKSPGSRDWPLHVARGKPQIRISLRPQCLRRH